MYPPQLNTLCAAFQNIDTATLHTADPGLNGDNVSAFSGSVSWGDPAAGKMLSYVTIADVTGSFTHIGLWDGSVFIVAEPCQIVDIVDQDLLLVIEFSVSER